MTDQPIKTRPDGSIDTDFYMRRGRHMRSVAAHEMFKSAPKPAAQTKRRGWLRISRRHPAHG